jgi:hypothetical protein
MFVNSMNTFRIFLGITVKYLSAGRWSATRIADLIQSSAYLFFIVDSREHEYRIIFTVLYVEG